MSQRELEPLNIRFVSLDHGHHMWEFPLQEDSIRIGRHPAMDLRLDDESVSDFQCQIDELAGAVWVQDVGSVQGTFVNGLHVKLAHLLPGDRLTVGETSLGIAYPPRRDRRVHPPGGFHEGPGSNAGHSFAQRGGRVKPNEPTTTGSLFLRSDRP